MKHKEIIDTLSLDEKIRLTSGDGAWHTVGYEDKGVPQIMMTDGPHGLRKQNDGDDINTSEKATCFPSAVTSGATWDRELIARMAKAIGKEALAKGISVVLGPGTNIKRNPKCGRNFEYFAEDPFLAGSMAAAYIEGMQSTGIGASLKHFAGNNQEYKRFNSDSQIDERTLREIYLRAFEIAVKKAKPATIMAAYPRLNGEFCTCNKWLLTDVLRTEWGYDGLVVSDWGAVARHTDAIKAGCDLGMPGGTLYEDDVVKQDVISGELPLECLDECCDRIIDLALMGDKIRRANQGAIYDMDEHDALTAKIASDGAVLLKNNGALPVKAGEKVLLVGRMAEDTRYQGAGSSHIIPTKTTSMKDVFKECTYIQGYDDAGSTTDEALRAVMDAAAKADKVIVAAGLPPCYESEGFDRATLDMPEGINRVIEAAAKANCNTTAVIMAGSCVLLPWIDKVNAVLFAGLCGQSGAKGICDVLTGKVCPSGHLTETWPMSLHDVPSEGQYSVKTKKVEYREGLYAGYRYYDKAAVKVRFPFGHGLSYTTFEYSDFHAECAQDASLMSVTVTVKNTGERDGAEVVQVYVENPHEGVYRAVKELRGFEKVFLKAGERKTVCIELDDRSFMVYDADGSAWRTVGGEYTIEAGSSSADIKVRQKVVIKGSKMSASSLQKGTWYEKPDARRPSRDEWLSLMESTLKNGAYKGNALLDLDNVQKGSFGMDSTMTELAEHSEAVKCFADDFKAKMAKAMGIKTDSDDEVYRMAVECTADCALHGMVLMSGGKFTSSMAHTLLDAANGKIADKTVYEMMEKAK